jgi:uncharacterized protein (TIGR02594 family)
MTREEACQKMHEVAVAEIGVHETSGPEATARIMEYERHTDRGYTGSDEEAWCAKFANFVTDTAGFPGTHHANARSFLAWGVPLSAPILGCIVVMKRGDSETQGHVTFCDHPDISNGVIRCLGGNQGDAVSVARFPVSKVLGYRSPV